VAVFAERHFVITKLADAKADTTETVVTEVVGDERLAELVRMLGGRPDDLTARDHARALLARAQTAAPPERLAARSFLAAPALSDILSSRSDSRARRTDPFDGPLTSGRAPHPPIHP